MTGLGPIHPGEHLAEILEELEISSERLAKAMGVPPELIEDILAFHAPITAETAMRLGKALRMTPHSWLGLQSFYDLDVARALGRRERHRTNHPAPARLGDSHRRKIVETTS